MYSMLWDPTSWGDSGRHSNLHGINCERVMPLKQGSDLQRALCFSPHLHHARVLRGHSGSDATWSCCGRRLLIVAQMDLQQEYLEMRPAPWPPVSVVPVKSLRCNNLTTLRIIQSSGIQTSAASTHPSGHFLLSRQILVAEGSRGGGASQVPF